MVYCSVTPLCHYLGLGARCTFGAQLGVVCHLQADLSDRSSITPFRRVQSCFLTYLRVLSIQSLGSRALPLSFLIRLHRVPSLLTDFAQSLLPYAPHSSALMDFSSEGLVIGGHSVWEESGLGRDRRLVVIDMLPDDVLVDVFNFYEDISDRPELLNDKRDPWHTLVHVCRRWRCLVFASTRRLNLRLTYRGYRPISEVLDAWPVLPISLILEDGRAAHGPSSSQ